MASRPEGKQHDRGTASGRRRAPDHRPADVVTTLPAAGSTTILPDPAGLLGAISRIGYSMSEALADLVDNSIDAQATTIGIRILRTAGRLLGVVISDDGIGMSAARMDQAMGFGIRTGKTGTSLGKYGMGLKSASFSQCSTLTVLSRADKKPAGRRWTTSGVRRGWECDHVAAPAAGRYLDEGWLPNRRTKTLVRWDNLPAFRIPSHQVDSTVAELFDAIALHLGIHFHRFLEGGLSINLDTVDVGSSRLGIPRPVLQLDPFDYPVSGDPEFPAVFPVPVLDLGTIEIEAHIWPRRSRSQNYRLGKGQVARRQGFYFYRNDRLIQGGGWNRLRADSEPHMSLARVRVNIGSDHDAAFGLNVQKSAVQVPDGFVEGVLGARAGDVTFADYLRRAEEAYRKTPGRGRTTDAPIVLGDGVPVRLRRALNRGAAHRAAGEISISWERLPDRSFFRIDRERQVLALNERYRRVVLNGARGSSSDAPLVKLLLFLRLRDDFALERIWPARRRELAELQELLLMAVEHQARR